MKRRDRVHVHNAAANEVNNRTIIRPYHNIETTDVQINKADNQVQNREDIVHPTVFKTETREEVLQAPGRTIITQPVHQHYIKEKDIHHIHRPVIKKKFVVRKVRIPTPVVQKIPIVRKVQARVNTKVLPAQTLVLRQ